MGINNLLEIFNEKYYENLEGGILESFGRLFRNSVKLYIYPMRKDAYEMYIAQGGEGHGSPGNAFSASVLINAKNVKIVDHLSNLYAHLLENHYIDCIVGFDTEHPEHLLARRPAPHQGEGREPGRRWCRSPSPRRSSAGGSSATPTTRSSPGSK